MVQLSPTVLRLLIANVVIFALPFVLGGVATILGLGDQLMALLPPDLASQGYESGVKSLIVKYLGLHNPESEDFMISQFLTAAFVHSDIGHLFGNMLGLMVFGPMLDYAVGAKRFLTFYLVTAVGAGAIYVATNTIEISQMKSEAAEVMRSTTPDNLARFMSANDTQLYRSNLDWFRKFGKDEDKTEYIREARRYVTVKLQQAINTPMVGASGAIMGILMAFGLLFPNTELVLLFPPIPIKAKFIVAGYMAYDIYRVIQNSPDDHVAHYAHLGGMIFGWIFVMYWRRNARTFY